MDRDLVLVKLESLRRCIDRIELKRPKSASELKNDLDAQDIIALNLQRSVQICVDIAAHILSEEPKAPVPSSMAGSFEGLLGLGILSEELALRMKKAVGFRNIAIHEYKSVDWNVVFAIATHHLEDFRRYGDAVLRWDETRAKNFGEKSTL
ncbi:type VII toxin-antitoxin system HepT family RNase toxin [Aminiphilus circumscriptus]|jgi:uncharacterized protein YutE (UPF0331/DUF86 family)|uniref:type VII toxin-antitoxin system HepT family RNase toxin n=1 Tax=Aminiphilus circumscriptus TaxID=290732 RepID=UPI00047866F4|nr:DUF86 domain-containing protein [Aminiphilus circumscriptus]